MNVGELRVSENLLDAVAGVSEDEWDKFFKSIKEQELTKMGELTDRQLTELQARVNIISEMRFAFSELRNQRPARTV